MSKAEDFYPKLLEAFRIEPGNIQHAAVAAGVHWKTAEKAWLVGNKRGGFPSIQSVINEERERARAMIEAERLAKIAERKREIEQSAEQAVQARKQEGQMTQLVRQQSLAALTSVSIFAAEARKLAEVIKGDLQIDLQKSREWTEYEAKRVAGDPSAIEPAWFQGNVRSIPSAERLLTMLQKMADYSRTINSCAREAMEMERLHLGEPIAVVRHEMEIREMTMEEVDTRTQNALRVIDRAREVGGLKVVQGGKASPVVGQRVVVR